MISCRAGTTSALINHLKNHPEEFKNFESNSKKRKASSSSSSKQPRLESFLPKNNFITADWTLYRFTPFVRYFPFFIFFFILFFVRYFPEKHTGKNISVSLDNMIEALGLAIENIELFSVNDNASNMKLAIRMSSYLTEYNCDIHTLELVLKDGIQLKLF